VLEIRLGLEFDIKACLITSTMICYSERSERHGRATGPCCYIDRWLKAPLQLADGTRVERTRGTPQGGVVSPVLSNLFLALYVSMSGWAGRFLIFLGVGMQMTGWFTARTEQEAQAVKAALQARLAECHLEMHPDKTQIVYCKDGSRKGKYPNTQFDFLGYTFRRRIVKNRKRNSIL